MLLTLLALATASAESPEDYIARPDPDMIYSCDDATWSGEISLRSGYEQEEGFTVIIEDSGGWATPPTIGTKGRAEFTLTEASWEHMRITGERLSAKTSAWIDLAVSSDYGTSVRRLYFGPAVVVEAELESRESYSLPDMASGSFVHESTISCYSEAPDNLVTITLDVEGAVIDGIGSYGMASEWLESQTQAMGLIKCDGATYTFQLQGRLTEPEKDGWVGVTVEESTRAPINGWYMPGFCGADADYIPGYGNWSETVEQMKDYVLFEGYELVLDEDGELVLVPKEPASEEDRGEDREEGSKKE